MKMKWIQDKYNVKTMHDYSVKEITTDFMTLIDENQTYTDLELDEISDCISILKDNPRTACEKLSQRLTKKVEAYKNETLRMLRLFEYERIANSNGHLYVAGIDEAGRGPLVGPVVAAAVILDSNYPWRKIDDSKKLTAEQREILYTEIIENAISYGIGISTNKEIDDINILNATKLAMKRAVESMTISPDFLLIDAVKLTDINIRQESIIKGDMKSASIAAASILAKVTRDRMLLSLHEMYPMYAFDKHKGYGTPVHYEAIRQFGILDEHRKSFLKSFFE